MNKLQTIFLGLLLFLLPISTTVVTLDNLKIFFESTYDRNNDGYATVQ